MAEPTASAYPAALDDTTTLFGDVLNLKQFTLDAGINASVQTISVTEDISTINVPCYLRIGSELIYCESKSSGDFATCTRGADGTTAASHLLGVALYVVYAANHYNQLKDAVIKIETELGINPSRSQSTVLLLLSQALDTLGNLDFPTSSELTIATGSVTPTQNWHTIDTEADAASDDLDTIVASGVSDGFVLFVRANNTARTVVIKHNTGNIQTFGASDLTLDETYKVCVLIYDATLTKWIAAIYIPGSASDTTQGIVELATAAETTTGTDAARAITPDGLAGSVFGEVKIAFLVSDASTTPSATGDGKVHVMIPTSMNGMNLVEAAGLVTTVSSSGTPTFAVRRERSGSAVDMLSTNITIDVSEKTSYTAAIAPAINSSNDDVATGDIIYIDLDTIGTGAKGHLVVLTFRLP